MFEQIILHEQTENDAFLLLIAYSTVRTCSGSRSYCKHEVRAMSEKMFLFALMT